MFKKGYGLANLEHMIPITPQTVFRIASVSKQFTAMAILLLEEEGLLSLSDDIRRFLPEFPVYDSVVKIEDLLDHASGIANNIDAGSGWEPAPDYFLPWAEEDDFFEEGLHQVFVPRREYFARLSTLGTLKFPPGTKYEYNNAGYDLLAEIVERASGRTLRQFASEAMFRPLGMTRTFFNDRAAEVVPGRADAYHQTPEGTYIKWVAKTNIVGAGGVFTTIEDYFLWDQNFYKNRLGKGDQALIDNLTNPNYELEYPDWILEANAVSAKGLLIAQKDAGRLEWANGGWVAFTASARRIRERQLSTFVFCNYSRQVSAPGIASSVLDLYLSVPREGVGD